MTPSCACGRAPRSGLKYIEIQPGTSKDTYESGDTIPVKQASEPLEFEDLFSTFDAKTRPHMQNATAGFGDAFAGRGQSINRAIEALNPLFRALDAGHDEPVRPGHGARPVLPPDRARLGTGRAGRAHAGAPVHGHGRHVRGDLGQPACASGHDREGGAHDGRLDRLVPRPAALLHDFTDLVHRLRPAAAELPRSLPAINSAFKVGTPVLPRTVELNENLEDALNEAEGPVREPQHAAGAPRPRHRADRQPPGDPVHRPVPDRLQLLHLLRPPAGRGAVGRPVGPDRRRHLAEPEHEGGELAPAEQLRRLDRLAAVGHPRGPEAAGREGQLGNPSFRLYAPPYQPGDRRPGQRRLPARPERLPERRAQQRPATARATSRRLRGARPADPGRVRHRLNGAIVPDDNNIPGLSGGTYKSRELGIDNLADVP